MNDGGQIEALERRIAALETAVMGKGRRIEINLTLPEADTGGLHFNRQEVHAVFEKQEDGWYHSRDILFMSARNVKDGSSRDVLTEYLSSEEFERALWDALICKFEAVNELTVSLPKEAEGVKQYNGVDCWYWLADRAWGSAAYFCNVSYYGLIGEHYATSVGGCAPMFRIRA